jgi:hypothetical protein
VSSQLHAPAALTRKRAPGTHWIGGSVGPRAGLDVMEKRKILPCRDANPGSPVRSLSLYQLSYSDSYFRKEMRENKFLSFYFRKETRGKIRSLNLSSKWTYCCNAERVKLHVTVYNESCRWTVNTRRETVNI